MTSPLDAAMAALFGFGLARTAALVVLAIAHASRAAPGPHRVRLSILIPAKDEVDVIAATVQSALSAAERADVAEIVVIDDGSVDGTADAIPRHPTVRIVRNERNLGKAEALMVGLQATTGEVIVTVDADTRLDSDALVRITAPFAAPEVTGVAGNVKVGNRAGWLGALQSIEYVGALNIDRRGQAALGCITTVPGAFGAWRRASFHATGRTLAEDTDLTLSIGIAGGGIVYAADAIAYTEAPDTLRGLYRQRLRWLQGNLQCLGHHAPSWPRASWRYAMLGLPDFAWRHLGAFALLPVSLAWAPTNGLDLGLSVVVGATSGLLALDVAVVGFAHVLDREAPDPVALVAQRLTWPLLSWVVFVGVLARWATGRSDWTRAKG